MLGATGRFPVTLLGTTSAATVCARPALTAPTVVGVAALRLRTSWGCYVV